MAMPAAHEWTVEEVLALPDDGKRYEVVDGELLVTPSPRLLHQVAIDELLAILRDYVKRERFGFLSMAPADIIGRAAPNP